MLSNQQISTDSFAKNVFYFGGNNRAEQAELFITRLIAIKQSNGTGNCLLKETVALFITQLNQFGGLSDETVKKYTKEIRALTLENFDSWAEKQFHSLTFHLLLALTQSHIFKDYYQVLKKIYGASCVFDFELASLFNFLDEAFFGKYGAVKFNESRFKLDPSQSGENKNKYDTLFYMMTLKNLYLFSPRPSTQLTTAKARSDMLSLFPRIITFVQELLVENDFDVKSYNAAEIFIAPIEIFLKRITKKEYSVFYDTEVPRDKQQQLSIERVLLIKTMVFINLDPNIKNNIINKIKTELITNAASFNYQASVLLPIAQAALDYDLEKLAYLLDGFITEENSEIAEEIANLANHHDLNNKTKAFLISAFCEDRFDYDDSQDDTLYIGSDKKILDASYFNASNNAASAAINKKLKTESERQRENKNKQAKKRKQDVAFSANNIYHQIDADQTASQNAEQVKRHKSAGPSSLVGNSLMFHGTITRRQSSDTLVPHGSPVKSPVKIHNAMSSNRSKSSAFSPVRASIIPPDLVNEAAQQPIGKVTDSLPRFDFNPAWLNAVTGGSHYILHARGSHLYPNNTGNKNYYFTTTDEQASQIESEINLNFIQDLKSPAWEYAQKNNRVAELQQVLNNMLKTQAGDNSSALHQMQEIYSNTYDRFYRTLMAGERFPSYAFQHHPFVSCGDNLYHAIRYGLADKVTGNRSADKVSVIYYEDGSVSATFVGQLWISLHRWADYCQLGKFHLLTEHAKGNVNIGDRIFNERETSFWDPINQDNIAMRVALIMPSFYGDYNDAYEQAFGMTKTKYTAFKNRISQAYNKKNKEADLEKIKSEIINLLISHYDKTIQQKIQQALEEKGSALVYHGLLDTPVNTIPCVDSARVLHIYHQHLAEITELLARFNALNNAQYSVLDYHHPLLRCLRLITAINSETQSVVRQDVVIAELRAYAQAKNLPILEQLLMFAESLGNDEKIILIFKAREQVKLNKARMLLQEDAKSLKELLTCNDNFIEYFIQETKNKTNSKEIFKKIHSIAKLLNEKFIFFKADFDMLFSQLFGDQLPKARSLLLKLKNKIDDYNLLEPPAQKETSVVSVTTEQQPERDKSHSTSASIAPHERAPVLHQPVAQIISDGITGLVNAISREDHERVLYFLNFPGEYQCAHKNTLLHLAIKTGNVQIIEDILCRVKSSDKTQENTDHLTPVHLACYSGRVDIFRLVYSHSITLDTRHLRQVLLNPNSSQEDKCALINIMLEKGIKITLDAIRNLVQQVPDGQRKVADLLNYVCELHDAITSYIFQATLPKRDSSLYKDIAVVQERLKSDKKISPRTVKHVLKQMQVYNNTGLLAKINQSSENYITPSALSMLLVRIHTEIFGRGRVNTVMAAAVLGDMQLLEALSGCHVDFHLTPNHGSTLNNRPIKRPIVFAIQYARSAACSYMLKYLAAVNAVNSSALLEMAEAFKASYQNLFSVFSQSKSLQKKHPEFYQQLCQAKQQAQTITSELYELSNPVLLSDLTSSSAFGLNNTNNSLELTVDMACNRVYNTSIINEK